MKQITGYNRLVIADMVIKSEIIALDWSCCKDKNTWIKY
jgi:hypothetical protein